MEFAPGIIDLLFVLARGTVLVINPARCMILRVISGLNFQI